MLIRGGGDNEGSVGLLGLPWNGATTAEKRIVHEIKFITVIKVIIFQTIHSSIEQSSRAHTHGAHSGGKLYPEQKEKPATHIPLTVEIQVWFE